MPSYDLADALRQAAQYINTRRELPEVLHDIVVTTRQALVPDVDHVGISVAHTGGRIQTLAATDDFVLQLDKLQYDLEEGPCLDAIRQSSVVIVNHAQRDDRWPRFMQEATARGLRSQMGIRLFDDQQTLGALNLYSTTADVLDADLLYVAELFASHAALALGRAKVESNMSAGMESRQRIGQAVGIIMERFELDEARAFSYLARVSQECNIKLRDIAEEVVTTVNDRNGLPSPRPLENSSDGHPS